MNLFRYFVSVAQRFPQKEALVFGPRRLTYSQLQARICRLADALHHRGVKKGDKVGLVCRNSDAYIEIFFALAKLGAVSEHFNWRLHPDVLTLQVAHSDVSMLFVSDQLLPHYGALKKNLPRPVTFVIVGKSQEKELHYHKLFQQDLPPSPTAECEAHDPCDILYTGGTTGLGKAVVHSVNGMLLHTMIVMASLDWNENTVLLCMQPLFHAASTGAYSTLLGGGKLVVADKFDPIECLALIEEEKVTKVGLVPHVVEWLVQSPQLKEYDLGSLDTIVYSGAPMAPEILSRAYRKLDCGFLQIYGMTELGPNVAVLTPGEHRALLQEAELSRLPVGKPILGTEIRIMEEDRLCPTGEIGEIVVRSDTLMLGYNKQPELTAQVVQDGWYHTGDNGYLDEDGYLYLSGRKKHMIICGGENIYPEEVEQAIHRIGNAVQDVAVIGVPNLRWGEVVKALIVRTPGMELNAQEVIAHCRRCLSPYKKPRIIQFVPEIPRNDSGKFDRATLLKQYENESGIIIDQDFLQAKHCNEEG